MRRILIAEDEPRIASFLEKGLRANGFTATVADDGRTAFELADSDAFDLLILDVGLPGRDGLSVLRDLRDRGSTLPVVILTARHSVEDTVAGFEVGADDYVTKPFRFEELLARVRARLRDDPVTEPSVLRLGAGSLDLRGRRFSAGERRVDLTAREFAMAELFFRHPGQILSRDQLLRHVWGFDYDPGSNVVEVYIRYLRQKLGRGWITTVRGIGYRMDGAPESPPEEGAAGG